MCSLFLVCPSCSLCAFYLSSLDLSSNISFPSTPDDGNVYTGFQTANGRKQVIVSSSSNFAAAAAAAAAAAVIKAGADLFPRGDSHKFNSTGNE